MMQFRLVCQVALSSLYLVRHLSIMVNCLFDSMACEIHTTPADNFYIISFHPTFFQPVFHDLSSHKHLSVVAYILIYVI